MRTRRGRARRGGESNSDPHTAGRKLERAEKSFALGTRSDVMRCAAASAHGNSSSPCSHLDRSMQREVKAQHGRGREAQQRSQCTPAASTKTRGAAREQIYCHANRQRKQAAHACCARGAAQAGNVDVRQQAQPVLLQQLLRVHSMNFVGAARGA